MTGPRVITEYAIRYSQLTADRTGAEPTREVKYRNTHRQTSAEDLAYVKFWQGAHPRACPEIDAVIVTRTLTYSEWTEAPATPYRGGPELDPGSEDAYADERRDYDPGSER